MPQPDSDSPPRLTRADGPWPQCRARRGHAARPLRQRGAGPLAEGAATIVIDPGPDHERAVRAYRRAGLAPRGIAPTKEGRPAPDMASMP